MRQLEGEQRKRFVVVAVALILLILTFGLPYVWTTMARSGELGAKEDYAVLQDIEYQHRSDTDVRSPLIVRNAGESRLTVLGVPSASRANPRQWFILDRVTSKGDVMRIPVDADIQVSCAFVARLQASERVNPRVVRYLVGVCK
jgi:hypothetical protein